MTLQRHGQRLPHGERRPQARVLERAAEAGSRPAAGAPPAHVDPVELDAAAVRGLEAADEVEDRRLAGAVRADEPEDLALVQRQVDVAHRGDAAEPLAQSAYLQRRRP